jgi:hypothetical protein
MAGPKNRRRRLNFVEGFSPTKSGAAARVFSPTAGPLRLERDTEFFELFVQQRTVDAD